MYSVINPVKDGLVADLSKWPGICTRTDAWLSGPITVQRPNEYFRQNDTEHERVTGQFTVPPQFASVHPADFAQVVRHRIEDELRTIRKARAGRSFVGAKALLRGRLLLVLPRSSRIAPHCTGADMSGPTEDRGGTPAIERWSSRTPN